MLRFSLVLTKDPGLTRWQIHTSDCPDVPALIKNGAFVEIVSARSAQALIASEIALRHGNACTEQDFAIMPCCNGNA
jgi:hypothetical protein